MNLTHNTYNLKLIDECIGLIKGLASQIVPPYHYSDEKAIETFNLLRGYKSIPDAGSEVMALMSNNKWFLIFDIRQQVFTYYHNAKTFYKYVHPDYLEDFIKVNISIYNFVHLPAQKQVMTLAPLNQAFEIIVPFWVEKLKQYMWVKQECRVWQVDKNHNLVTHINFYSIARPFNEQERLPMYAIIWDVNSDYMDWTPYFQQFHVLRQPLTFSRTQARILHLYHQHPDIKSHAIAVQLGLTEHAIQKCNKGILKKVRDCFPAIPFHTVKKDVVPFVHQIGFFN
jgi:hypothetical protein